MNKLSRGKVVPHDDSKDILEAAAKVINITTLGEEEETKRSFIKPGLINDYSDALGQDLKIKDFKSDELDNSEEIEVKMDLNDKFAVKTHHKDIYAHKNVGSALCIAKCENQFKVNVYISSFLAIIGSVTCVVEQELYLVYWNNNSSNV